MISRRARVDAETLRALADALRGWASDCPDAELIARVDLVGDALCDVAERLDQLVRRTHLEVVQ